MSAGRSMHAGVAALAATLSMLAAPAVSSAAVPPGKVPNGAVKLSDERTRSTYGYAASYAPIRDRAALDARKIGRLRLRTELGGAEVYLVLNRWRDDAGLEWLRIRIPGRPNGRIGWVSASALGTLRTTTTSVEVQKWRNRVLVRRDGRVVFRAPVGHGKRGTPTPAGRYWIRDRFKINRRGDFYGPRALGTGAYAPRLTDWPLGGVIGFHGTSLPHLVPGRPSNGCIRMRNGDIRRFYRLVRTGTPVWIH